MEIEINYLAVLVSGIAYMVIGMLWYGPLFGKPWMELMRITPESIASSNKSPAKAYTISFVASLVTAYVFEIILSVLGIINILGGISVAIIIFIGFVAMTTLTDYLYGNTPLKLYLINNGYRFAYLIVMGAILTIL